MTAVPPAQPPAAPETDVRLTDAERDYFCGNLRQNLGYRARVIEDTMLRHVERIVAERVRVVEGERDAWKARRDAAVEQCRHLHQDGKTREQWHLDNCGAMRALRLSRDTATNALEALAASGAETAEAEARAESAEAAHAALVAAVEALADECPSPWLETRLRALLPSEAR